MKGYQLVVIAFAALFAFSALAMAEEALASSEDSAQIGDGSEISSEPGITPDSSFYGLKNAWERLNIAFTFNQERKAQKELALAQRKLLEIRKMAEKGNVQAMERAQLRHDALVESAQARLAAIQDDTTEANAKLAAKKLIRMKIALKAHENRIEILQDVLSEKNLSDEARTAIESAIERMQNRTERMNEALKAKEDRIKTRLRALTEKNESEIEEAFKEMENSEGYSSAIKKIAERRIENTEQAIARVKERLETEKASGLNLSEIEAHIAEAEENLAKAKALYEEGKYEEAIKTIKPVSNYGRNLSVAVRAINQARLSQSKEKLQERLAIAARERIKERIREETKNLSPEARQEIKAAIAEELKERAQKLANKVGK